MSADNVVTVKGPKGELKQALDRDIKVEVNGTEVVIARPTDQIRHRALHGLYRSLVANMVEGVTNGYTKTLELVGVGYRAAVTGQQLDMSLGYSHQHHHRSPGRSKSYSYHGKRPASTYFPGIYRQTTDWPGGS